MNEPRLLYIGDGPMIDSGFGRETDYSLRGLDYRLGGEFDCSVLGLNYLGDPYDRTLYPYDVYPCWPGRDMLGVGRLLELVPKIRPDVILIQNDPYNVPHYTKLLRELKAPCVGILAVDGKNCKGGDAKATDPYERGLNDLALSIFWTEFGKREAVEGGYEGRTAVVPLGVDRDIYHLRDRALCRTQLGLPKDGFIVLNVNRNQWRKRMDLMLMLFAEWVQTYKRDDVILMLHSAPTGDKAVNLRQLAEYLHRKFPRVKGKIILSEPDPRKGLTQEDVARLYCAANVLASTSQTEGFSLPTIEAMACGTPTILPALPALAELYKNASVLIPIAHEICKFEGQDANVLGGAPDKNEFIAGLELLYSSQSIYKRFSELGLKRASEKRFDWKHVGAQLSDLLIGVLNRVEKEQEATVGQT